MCIFDRSQCPDLFDELLDLVEEVAFAGTEEVDEFEGCEDDEGATLQITTMRNCEPGPGARDKTICQP